MIAPSRSYAIASEQMAAFTTSTLNTPPPNRGLRPNPFDANSELAGLVDDIFGDARSRCCDQPLGHGVQHFVIALKRCGFAVVFPVGLEDHLGDTAGTMRLQSHRKALTCHTRSIANLPIIALLASIREEMRTKTLCAICQVAGEITDFSLRTHDDAPAALDPTGCLSRAAASTSCDPMGINTRVFH